MPLSTTDHASGSAKQVVSAPGGASRAPRGSSGIIAMHLRAIGQLFDPIDPSPFGEQDLSEWAAEYIVESVKEMESGAPCQLVVRLDEPPPPMAIRTIGDAVRSYFARQAELRGRALKRLMRRGAISLAIGIAFLAGSFGLSRLAEWLFGTGPVVTVLSEGSMIIGWVAMWRPLEIFLYEWWPIMGERRLHTRLSQAEVRIVGPQASRFVG